MDGEIVGILVLLGIVIIAISICAIARGLKDIFGIPKKFKEIEIERSKLEMEKSVLAESQIEFSLLVENIKSTEIELNKEKEELTRSIGLYREKRYELIQRFNNRMSMIDNEVAQRAQEDIQKERAKMLMSFAADRKILDHEFERKKETLENSLKKEKERLIQSIETDRNNLNKEKERIEEKIELYNRFTETLQQDLEKIVSLKCDSFPYLAGLVSDIQTVHYEKSRQFLLNKKNPAKVEAQRIGELKKETREILYEKKILEYKIAYIEKLFPNIVDIFDSGFSQEAFELETQETTDRVRLYLSEDEYKALSESDRNQMALDRYMQRNKTKWQIGRDYEMYIGYCIEQMGISVKYTGIIERLEDMGRDLIAEKGKSAYIIQCKNWSQEKTIHEKHLFQLYGTMILYKIEHPNLSTYGAFVTSTNLSETAKKVAKELGIEVFENVCLKDFPRIKCNINRTTKEKIYHLPFDQQYDSAVIQKNSGEFYAHTVKEAEDAGFRRAMKHFV